MTVLAIDNAALYCPKCKKTYEEGSQRFCSDEAVRLLPVPSSDRSASRTNGVFSKILSRKSRNEDGKFSSVHKFSQDESKISARPNLRLPATEIFKNAPEFELKLEIESLPKTEFKPPVAELREQLARLNEVKINPKAAENRKTASDDTQVFHLDNPRHSPGQTVINRYRIVEQIGAEDESGVIYLAEDISAADKKVSLKMLSGDAANVSFADKIFAEERISLARINHPNIVNILDSGVLPGGKPYIVTEYVEGVTVKEQLEKNGRFDALRAARIIRQASDALSEAHQSSVPHRNLKPEDIILFVDEDGVERVKLTNFGAAKEKLNERNLLYKSPEQVGGKIANFTGDGYSLAVIAYQMLTDRLPFNASSIGDLLKSQREGLLIGPSEVRFDLPPSVDDILKRALSFNSFDRYRKARDFGDEFFSEIIVCAASEAEDEVKTISIEVAQEEPVPAPVLLNKEKSVTKVTPLADDYDYLPVIREAKKAESVKAARDLARTEGSLERSNQIAPPRSLVSVFGIAILLAALLGVTYYFVNRPNQSLAPTPTENTDQSVAKTANLPTAETNFNAAPTTAEIKAPLPLL